MKRSAKALIGLSLAVALLPATQLARAPHARAATGPGSITLAVQSAMTVGGVSTKGDAIANYKWLINVDDTGDPGTIANQGTQNCLPSTAANGAPASQANSYADSCPWPSVRNTSGFAPIVAQGTQDDLNRTTSVSLPVGKYLISVTADGFKIDGQHFTVSSGSSQQVGVQMNATPLPLSTLRLQVFNDTNPVDATYEVDAERGLAGFTATLTDVFGLVSTDYYGNALCTKYVHDSAGHMVFSGTKPMIDPSSTGKCVSDASGQIVIPNLGSDRYAATVAPPITQIGQWVQTTTLEGGHDHDIWEQEGSTGYDTEQTKGAELVPAVQFGFVKKMPTIARSATGTGTVKGVAIAGLPYIGGQNGQVSPETGLAGVKSGGPIANAWIALSDLDAGDQQVYTGQAGADGKFSIPNVATGSYQLSIWDDDQDYILWSFNIEVTNGQVTDVGNKIIVGWFTHVYGHVFIDSNGNGRMDPGEKGVPQFVMTVRERDNSLMDQATNTASTNDSGLYDIRETYPLGKFLVLEGFNTRYRTTGITYQGENDPKPTTQLGSMVDINFLPIIGLGGEIDWGVEPYSPGSNGGIVGTVTYDTTRNELDPADAVTEAYQPGIPGINVHLYLPIPCDANTPADHCRQGYVLNDDGSMKRGPKVQDDYTTETWSPPRGCTARQYNGQPLTDQQALPPFGATANAMCVEAPMMGIATGVSDATGGSQTVNGNYGFSTSKINQYPVGDPRNPAPNHDLPLYADLASNGYPEQDLAATDYLVGVDIPNNPAGPSTPMYKVTTEADVNVFSGDGYVPQENYPPASQAQADQQDQGAQTTTPKAPTQPPSQQAGIISPCAGPLHKITVTNPDFLAVGGSPFEGQDRPYCTDKLVTVRAGQSTAPNFNLYTDVPIPTHFWGLTLNDLGLTLDKRSVNYGEAQGMPFVPVGLYDWSGRLDYTAHTDFNGLYEALVPSTDTYNCPVPAGPCPNMYRFVGNDPGQPGALNADYNPRFRTIATNFQAWPGLYTVTDEAPTQVATTALAPDTTTVNPTQCDLGPNTPQLLAVDRPVIRRSDANRTITVSGFGFGATPGTVKLGTTTLSTTAWSDTSIKITVPNGPNLLGSQPITITRSDGRSGYNSLTLQVLSPLNTSTPGALLDNPAIVEVGPGAKSADAVARYTTVQAALEAAKPTPAVPGRRGVPSQPAKPYWLVVVYPNDQTSANPQGEYTENLIVHHQVHIQGVGPGGFRPDGSFVRGSILDGSGFNPDNAQGQNWVSLLSGLRYSGNPAVPDAAVVTVLDDPATPRNLVPSSYHLSLDGFGITGGAQSDFPANINELTGTITTPYGAAGALVTQGGGIYLHSNVQGMQITDNVIRGNGGSYGGAIRVGTPYVGDNRNYDLTVANNQIRDNGGTNLAGGIGLFTGSDGYQINHNALCGNFSAEYGGAISAFGYQENSGRNPGGSITANRIWFNASYDEGGAVMIAGELPADPTQLSPGTGRVSIDGNIIQANLANDDGGGIRLLQVTGSHVTNKATAQSQAVSITNNTVANNVSAHEGGGIALDDAAFVNIVGNTIAKNLTTATAVTSDGSPAPAGLSTATNSDPLQARLATFGAGTTGLATTTYSKPTLLNNVFWDNRAGNFDGGVVCGIDSAACPGINNWDMGVADDPSATLNPTHSVLQTTQGITDDGTNKFTDPGFVSNYDVDVNILASRTYPAFRQAIIVAQILPPSLMGDYHLSATSSSAYGAGAASTLVSWGGTARNPWTYTVSSPATDIDGQRRPGARSRYDAGSDQLTP